VSLVKGGGLSELAESGISWYWENIFAGALA